MKWILRISLFVFLTVVTQIGGLVYVLILILRNRIRFLRGNRFKQFIGFVFVYLTCTLLLVPAIAPIFGRKALPINPNGNLVPHNYFIVLANRHYVTPDLYHLIETAASNFNRYARVDMDYKINYLDANFPFINGFPLIPHLSHNDGKKLDLSFRYDNKADHTYTNQTNSVFGYGVFAEPRPDEENITKSCKEGHWQYDVTKYIGIKQNDHLEFSESETKRFIELLIEENTSKIFIEPNLKSRLNLTSDKVRFHGCHAVRHDDHIHIQIK